jgi:GntR family transcriptional regulator/MocR family aminotransferase
MKTGQTAGTMACSSLSRPDRRKRAPLSQQIYQRLREAIDTRALRPGARVASARVLASELGVARGTVEAAYQRLQGEGYLIARGAAGTIVSQVLPQPSVPVPERARPAAQAAPPRASGRAARACAPPLPFQLGIPALDAFPRKQWARLVARHARTTSAAQLAYDDARGHAPLREAIAAYVSVSRGVACGAEQVFVTGGYRASLALIVHTLLAPRDRVWIEDPCYPATRQLLEAAGRTIVPVPLDGAGLDVEAGRARSPRAGLAIVTPGHQAPLGVSMSMARRLQLLDWAACADAWILEDDYDGEFRYGGVPLPALKHLDGDDRVLYAGSFSKVLFPALGLGYLVVPERLVERFNAQVTIWQGSSPRAVQAAVAEFIEAGHFARHLKKMRALYARRRAYLCDALIDALGPNVKIDSTRGGMHLVVRLRRRANDVTLAGRAQAAGLNCQPLSPRYAGAGGDNALLMGFTNVASAEEAARLAARLARALRQR